MSKLRLICYVTVSKHLVLLFNILFIPTVHLTKTLMFYSIIGQKTNFIRLKMGCVRLWRRNPLLNTDLLQKILQYMVRSKICFNVD